MNKQEAINLAKTYVSEKYENLVLFEEFITDHGHYYSLYYNSARYKETRNIKDSVIGQGPLIVEKSTGRIFSTGSANTIEYYVENLLKGGHPYSQPSNEFTVSGSNPTLRQKLYKTFKETLSMPAKQALTIARELETQTVNLEASTPEQTEKLIKELTEVGLEVKQLWKH